MNKIRMRMIISIVMGACIVFGCGKNPDIAVTEASAESEVLTEPVFDGEEGDYPFCVVEYNGENYVREYYYHKVEVIDYENNITEDEYFKIARVEIEKSEDADSKLNCPVSDVRVMRLTDGHTLYDGKAGMYEDVFSLDAGNAYDGRIFINEDYFAHLISICSPDCTDLCNIWSFITKVIGVEGLKKDRDSFLREQGFEGQEPFRICDNETGDCRTEVFYDGKTEKGCFLVTHYIVHNGVKTETDIFGTEINEVINEEKLEPDTYDYSDLDKDEEWESYYKDVMKKRVRKENGKILEVTYDSSSEEKMLGSTDHYIYREDGSLCWHEHDHGYDMGTVNISISYEYDDKERLRQYTEQLGHMEEAFYTWFYPDEGNKASCILELNMEFGSEGYRTKLHVV